jgi:transposase
MFVNYCLFTIYPYRQEWRHLPRSLLIVWDGLRCHRSQMECAFVRRQHGRMWLEFVPAYAPELNPMGYLWSHWKHHELPNLCPTTFGLLGRLRPQGTPAYAHGPALVTALLEAGRLVCLVTLNGRIPLCVSAKPVSL